jgi:hypothetical protein
MGRAAGMNPRAIFAKPFGLMERGRNWKYAEYSTGEVESKNSINDMLL